MRYGSAFLTALGCLLIFGCSGGQKKPGDRAGTVNETLRIEPAAPYLVVGQSVQFEARTPWGKEAIWSVLPATGGTITAGGRFTAGSVPGSCTVMAVWAKDVRYAATTPVTTLAAPPPVTTTPDLVQASGGQQTVPGTGISNGAIANEQVPATTATGNSGAIRVRHGFDPPVAK